MKAICHRCGGLVMLITDSEEIIQPKLRCRRCGRVWRSERAYYDEEITSLMRDLYRPNADITSCPEGKASQRGWNIGKEIM